nr:hypothetical protein [Tanacetum cinerariifolium]
MSKDPFIPRRNKVNWHYVRDDHMFSIIKLVSRHQNTQQFGALLPIELTNEEIRNSNAYKEFYAVAIGAAPPKPKASVRRTKSSFDITITSPTADAGPRLTTSAKGKQAAKAFKAKSLSPLSEVAMTEAQQLKLVTKISLEQTHISQASVSCADEGTGSIPGVPYVPSDESEEELSWNSTNKEGDDDEGNDDDGMELIFETTLQMDVPTPTSVTLLPMSAPTMTPYTISTITTTSQAPILLTTAPSTIIQDLPNFGSLFGFDNRLRTLEANFSKFMQTNQFAGAVSTIPGIIHRYMDLQLIQTVHVAVQLQSDKLHEEAQKENDEFLKTIDENMQTIIKEQVKEQVKVQVSKILPRIEQNVNEQLEAKVLTRSSHSSKTSYAIAADLSKMELKKILIEKMEGNKSIQLSDEQRNLYKALVEAYEFNKIILDTYGETVTLKRRHDDDADKDEEPSDGPDKGSKRRGERKEPESASAPTETATRSAGRRPPSLDRAWNTALPAAQGDAQSWISDLAKQADARSSFNELLNTPIDFSNFIMHRLNVDTLTPDLLAGPTYELMRGSCSSLTELEYHLEEPLPLIPNNRGRRVIPFKHFINNDLEYLRGGASSRKYTTFVTKMKAADFGHIKWIEDLVPRAMWIQEPINYDRHALWGVSHSGRKRQQFYGDGMLNDVRNALDDRLKGIQMQYLPTTIWRRGDKDRAAAMI